MPKINTHSLINRKLSGEPVELEDGRASVRLKITKDMVVDEKGLAHGGFLFSAADYAAMLSVNHPNVVLASARVKFLKPVKLGDEVLFKAKVCDREGKKVTVEVTGSKKEEKVFEGSFLCIIPKTHVLKE